jgi:antitoxin (DNA-binding transcriptional repressor) of toxin-antitoxin stability system
MYQSSQVPSVVAVGELKARLSEYLRLVKGGRELVVTERGLAIARITLIAGAEARDSRIEELVQWRCPVAETGTGVRVLAAPAAPRSRWP